MTKTKKTISTGVVHTMPSDLKQALSSSPKILTTWESITPLARNEWICWVISSKKEKTRARRIKIAKDKLLAGLRRPCCWAGCSHR
ncbi:MAG: YdeI/OmpD-associated family protein [Patescibacteria group bacterium]|nr:MAG: YdeI/OmpD-associated family protein [Patescibacteria group bacterium]